MAKITLGRWQQPAGLRSDVERDVTLEDVSTSESKITLKRCSQVQKGVDECEGRRPEGDVDPSRPVQGQSVPVALCPLVARVSNHR